VLRLRKPHLRLIARQRRKHFLQLLNLRGESGAVEPVDVMLRARLPRLSGSPALASTLAGASVAMFSWATASMRKASDSISVIGQTLK